MKICYVLRFFKDGKHAVYVGQTSDFEKRLKRHLTELKRDIHHNANLQALYNDGWVYDNNPIIHIVNKDENPRLKEKELIEKYLAEGNCVNIELMGDTLSLAPNKEERIKNMTAGVINRFVNLTEEERAGYSLRVAGKNNPMYGKTHSQKSRETISKKLRTYYQTHQGWAKGTKLSPEHRKAVSDFAKTRKGDKNPFYGRTHSEKTREILSKKLKGQRPPNERKIMVEGVLYQSAASCARKLGLNTSTVTWRARQKDKFLNWKYVD